MAMIIPFRAPDQGNRGTSGFFFNLPVDEQRERIVKLARTTGFNAATLASMCGRQAAEIERILGDAS